MDLTEDMSKKHMNILEIARNPTIGFESNHWIWDGLGTFFQKN